MWLSFELAAPLWRRSWGCVPGGRQVLQGGCTLLPMQQVADSWKAADRPGSDTEPRGGH